MEAKTKFNVKENMKNKTSENPFYGMKNTLTFFQQVPKMSTVNRLNLFSMLDNAWDECKNTIENRQLFFVIFFKHLDISNREHNVFKKVYGNKKLDKGGDALRNVGIYQLEWLLNKTPQLRKQFYDFLFLIPEYSNFENVFFNQLRTNRNTGQVISNLSIIPKNNKEEFINEITTYLAEKISNSKTTDFEHTLIGKFLPKPKFSKRKRSFEVSEKGLNYVRKTYGNQYNVGDVVVRKANLKKETIEKEMFEYDFISILSLKLNWEIAKYENNTRFIGLEKYKAKYNRLSEAYLFSSKEILNYDKEQFISWLDKLPSGARYRVSNRLFDKKDGELISTNKWISKYGNLSNFYSEWLKSKEVANQKVRELENKGELTDDEKILLEKTKKEAKINTVGENLIDIVSKLIKNKSNSVELDVIADNLLRKIDMKVPVLTFVDRSGSMSSKSIIHNDVSFSARDISKLTLTMFLLKNPSEELSSIFGLFSSQCEIVTDNKIPNVIRKNRFEIGNVSYLNEPIIDKTKPFSWNFARVSKIIDDFELATSTDISSVATKLKEWVDSDPNLSEVRKETINKYPVFLIISDGDMNNAYDATASMNDFKMKMKQWFSCEPVIVVLDCKSVEFDTQNHKFENIENVMYFSTVNHQTLQQIFSNIHDLDVIDIYTPLLSIFRSNRYELVKNKTN